MEKAHTHKKKCELNMITFFLTTMKFFILTPWLKYLKSMERFYSREERDDIKSGCAENSVVNKVGSVQKLRQAQLMGPYSGFVVNEFK